MADFAKNKSMEFPRIVEIRHDAIDGVADVCQTLKFGKRGLIITGEETRRAAGERILDLVSEKYDVDIFAAGNATCEEL